MIFAKVENGVVTTYPYTLRLFKMDNPNVSPPNNMEALGDFGVAKVTEVDRPEPSDPLAVRVVEVTPTEVNGVWTQTWAEEPLSASEIADNQRGAAYKQLEDAARADAFIQQFVQYDAQQVQDYIETNVTNLASSKAVLKKLALICLVLAKTRLS